MARSRERQAVGAYGERLAARHLTMRGMTLLERNWRCSAGEVDLVLREGDVLVFCEVKTRRGVDFGHPLEAVGAIKVERLHRLAALWIEAAGVQVAEIRLDAVGILLPRHGAPVLSHVRGIG